MKKIILLISILFSAMIISAQGIYQLWGTAGGGEYDRGVIFKWDPNINDYTKKFDFNMGCA